MTLSITTRSIGVKYGIKGPRLERLRKQLTRLDYIKKDKYGSIQAYIQLKDLPEDADFVQQEYSDRYYKTNPISAVGDALSEIESLSGEMCEWRDNMGQYEGLSATSKYDEVETAADTLENQKIELEDMQSDLEKLEGLDGIEITSRPPFDPYMYGHSMGRARRLANALADLNAVAEGLTAFSGEDVEQLSDRLADIISELEGVDFPTL